MKKFIIFCCLISFPVYAQNVNENQEYTIKLNGKELDLIGTGLGTQAYKDVAPLLQKLREQVVIQQQKIEPKKEEQK